MRNSGLFIVLKQFYKFVKVNNSTPFKNSLFFYFMLIHHLSNVEHGVTIRKREFDFIIQTGIICTCPQSHRGDGMNCDPIEVESTSVKVDVRCDKCHLSAECFRNTTMGMLKD